MLGYLTENDGKSELLQALELDPDALRAKILELLPAGVEPEKHPDTVSERTLEDCYAWLGGRELADVRAETLWDALIGAAREKNIGAALAYGLLIAHKNRWNAQDAALQIIDEARRRFKG